MPTSNLRSLSRLLLHLPFLDAIQDLSYSPLDFKVFLHAAIGAASFTFCDIRIVESCDTFIPAAIHHPKN